jgi:hypothetical protein
MSTSAKHDGTRAPKPHLKVKLASGLAGLAMAGIVIAACSTTSAGTIRQQPSQYRHAMPAAPAMSEASEREILRREHLVIVTRQFKATGRETLRQEHGATER